MVVTDASSTETAPVHTTRSTINALGWLEYSKLLAKCNKKHKKSCPLVALEKVKDIQNNHQTCISIN
jgi:hypothetical protein